jgi:hypothetical protein
MLHRSEIPPRFAPLRRVVDDVVAVGIALAILLAAIARPSVSMTTPRPR